MNKILISTLLFITMGANAADWVELDSNKEKSIYVDADSIKYANKALNQRKSWVKIKYKKSEGQYRAGEYTLASQTFDCNNNKFLVNTIVGYTANGQVRGQTTQNTGWMNIPPESNFEYILNSICSYPHI